MDHLDCEDLNPEDTAWPCFDFRGFEPSESVKQACKNALDEQSKLITQDCTLVSRVEHDGIEYCCSFDLFQRRGSIYSIDVDRDAVCAVKNAAEKLKNELIEIVNASPESQLYYANTSPRENEIRT